MNPVTYHRNDDDVTLGTCSTEDGNNTCRHLFKQVWRQSGLADLVIERGGLYTL